MSPSASTTYLGHRIDIERFEFGYLAHVVEPESKRRLTAAHPTALEALERAFDMVEQQVKQVGVFAAVEAEAAD